MVQVVDWSSFNLREFNAFFPDTKIRVISIMRVPSVCVLKNDYADVSLEKWKKFILS